MKRKQYKTMLLSVMYTVHTGPCVYTVRSIEAVRSKTNEKSHEKEDTIESVAECKKICVGARLCKVFVWCVFVTLRGRYLLH